MAPLLTLSRDPRRARIVGIVLLAALAVFAARALLAQVEGDRGIAAVASSSDISVGGIEVDVRAKNSADARQEGWKQAERKGWEKLGGPAISDGQLSSMVSAVVIEHEELGPTRYIARLGIIFDRTRAAGLLGAKGAGPRSAPMLLIPVTYSAGTATVYEVRNPWQRAWAEYQPGTSRIDYVRPSGAGGDSLLLTAGQTTRRSRTWWRNVLDQFGASDVLIADARLDYRWPGGPVDGHFTARYGPDNRYLGEFAMTAQTPAQLPAMLAQAVARFDGIFEQALTEGKLAPDPTLNLGAPQLSPAVAQLIAAGRAAEQQDRAQAAAAAAASAAASPTPTPGASATPVVVSSFAVQFASPNAAAVDAALAAARGAVGVRGAVTSSLAIGGTSVMTVSFGGTIEQLAAALKARGFTVRQAGSALSISR